MLGIQRDRLQSYSTVSSYALTKYSAHSLELFVSTGSNPSSNPLYIENAPLNSVAEQHEPSGLSNTRADVLANRPQTPMKPFSTVPFRRDPDFVDRADILDQIDQCCSQPGGRVALVGLGGVG